MVEVWDTLVIGGLQCVSPSMYQVERAGVMNNAPRATNQSRIHKMDPTQLSRSQLLAVLAARDEIIEALKGEVQVDDSSLDLLG